MNINVGNLVKVDLGYFPSESDPLISTRKFEWAVVTEIRREGERLMVKFVRSSREFQIKRYDVKQVVG